LDNQHRFSVPRRLFEQCDLNVPAGETVVFWGAIGEFGQVQLLPRESELSRIRDSLGDFSGTEAAWDAGADPDTRLRRRLQSFLNISCHARTKRGRVSLTFSADAIKQGHFKARSVVIVTTTDKIFEVWSKENWQPFTRVDDLRQLTDEARELVNPDR
jgi:DNA-binding transcriptional regulator/RsmH inhibitor MraZ